MTSAKIANTTVVRSINNLTDSVSLQAGPNITITPAGSTLTIAATGALTGVTHDATLSGGGSAGSPLGITVPLSLRGSGDPVLTVSNSNGNGLNAAGGGSGSGVFGTGSVGLWGDGSTVRPLAATAGSRLDAWYFCTNNCA